ncbi:MAG: alginate O-acetyltransferase AlgX-related protein [Verrucomicrobiales bacterium]
MKRFRDPSWTLIFLFLGILVVVPLVQTIQEATQEGEGIKAFHIFSQAPTAQNLRAFEEGLESDSWAAKLSRPWLQFATFKWLKDGGEKVVTGSSGWYFFKPGLNYMLARREIAEAAREKNDPVMAIVHFRNELAAQGIKLLVVPVPNKDSVYPDLLAARAGNLRSVLAPRTREILERLKGHDVQIVDLFKEFGEARKQSSGLEETPLYLAQDTHWSPRGVEVAAQAAARRLIELGWALPGEVEYNEKPAPVERLGDLVMMLQSPMIQKATKPEHVQAVQVVSAADGKLYNDKAEASITVIGDSFLRIFQQDTPTSAGFISHLAKELKQPMMSIVNDGGGSTLVREELAARPLFLKDKKVVVWEFVERDLGAGLRGWQRISLPPPVSAAP